MNDEYPQVRMPRGALPPARPPNNNELKSHVVYPVVSLVLLVIAAFLASMIYVRAAEPSALKPNAGSAAAAAGGRDND